MLHPNVTRKAHSIRSLPTFVAVFKWLASCASRVPTCHWSNAGNSLTAPKIARGSTHAIRKYCFSCLSGPTWLGYEPSLVTRILVDENRYIHHILSTMLNADGNLRCFVSQISRLRICFELQRYFRSTRRNDEGRGPSPAGLSVVDGLKTWFKLTSSWNECERISTCWLCWTQEGNVNRQRNLTCRRFRVWNSWDGSYFGRSCEPQGIGSSQK